MSFTPEQIKSHAFQVIVAKERESRNSWQRKETNLNNNFKSFECVDLVQLGFITDQSIITTVCSSCQLTAFPAISIITSLQIVLNKKKG